MRNGRSSAEFGASSPLMSSPSDDDRELIGPGRDDDDIQEQLVHMETGLPPRRPHHQQNGGLSASFSSRSSTPLLLSPYSTTPPTLEDWDDAYANERITRFAVALFMIIGAAAASPLALSFLHDIAPWHPLPDTIFSLIDEQPWARVCADTLVTIAGVLAAFIGFIHRYRLVVLRRTAFIAACLYGLRVICLFSTQLPVAFSNATEYCSPKILAPDFTTYLSRFFTKFIAFGTSVADNDLCGDMLYSGHTIVFTTCLLNARHYLPRRLQFARWVITPACFFGMLCLIMSRIHYTIDVVVGYFMTLGWYTVYHAYVEMPHENRRKSILRQIWLLHFAHWFERPVPAGKMPNRCALPAFFARWPLLRNCDSLLRGCSDPMPLPEYSDATATLASRQLQMHNSLAATSSNDDDDTTNPLIESGDGQEKRTNNNGLVRPGKRRR